MSQFDELAVPTKIPDELWHDINRVRTALVTFVHNARMSVEAKELRTGEYDLEFYRWSRLHGTLLPTHACLESRLGTPVAGPDR